MSARTMVYRITTLDPWVVAFNYPVSTPGDAKKDIR